MPLNFEALQGFLQANWVVLLASLWTLPWKGVALWKAAGLKDKKWFILIFVLNTLAILDIVYIFFISKKRSREAVFHGT